MVLRAATVLRAARKRSAALVTDRANLPGVGAEARAGGRAEGCAERTIGADALVLGRAKPRTGRRLLTAAALIALPLAAVVAGRLTLPVAAGITCGAGVVTDILTGGLVAARIVTGRALRNGHSAASRLLRLRIFAPMVFVAAAGFALLCPA
jgi:hypothetical protein